MVNIINNNVNIMMSVLLYLRFKEIGIYSCCVTDNNLLIWLLFASGILPVFDSIWQYFQACPTRNSGYFLRCSDFYNIYLL
jgi:hypothetical protein